MTKLVPVNEFKWPAWQDIGPLYTLTCENHQNLRWSTKHPLHRSLHYLGPEDEKVPSEFVWKECPCEYADLRVIVEETENA